MKIITLNVNGIRSAARKGFFGWLASQQADIVCLQETRVQAEQITSDLFYPKGYYCYYHDAQKRGYSGVALYAKKEPKQVVRQLGWEVADKEARYLKADFGDLSVISLYMPSGSSGEVRQAIKFDFLAYFQGHLRNLKKNQKQAIICGDWNIAHKKIDIKNWRGNQKNSGFLPSERAWMDELFGSLDFVDAFRVINQESDQYTWWSNRGQAWLKNVGWRIDYQVITPGMKDSVKQVQIYKQQRFSDHAPLIINYDI